MKRIWAVFFFSVLVSISCEKQNDTGQFVATKQWQEVKDGQKVPAGLHVRINLTTGKKEAKLLDENEDNNNRTRSLINVKQSDQHEEHDSDAPPKEPKISKTLSDALKQMNQAERIGLEYTPEQLTVIKHKYKSYKELKETYEEMRPNFKTDGEVLIQLLDEFKNSSQVDSDYVLKKADRVQHQIKILEDLDYLVHQIDNSLLFVNKGGLDMLLPIIANETNVDLRVKAMRVLGALTQNNPQAQIKAFEHNSGTHLAKVLISSTNTDEQAAALYAFGSLLRKFPYAEKQILSTSGMQVLVNVLSKDCELRVKAKAATLISDIILEQKQVLSGSSDPETAKQYAELKITDWLESNNFCSSMELAIESAARQLLEAPDILEYFLEALDNTRSFCTIEWSRSLRLQKALTAFKDHYGSSTDVYHREIAEQVSKVIAAIFPEAENSVHATHSEL